MPVLANPLGSVASSPFEAFSLSDLQYLPSRIIEGMESLPLLPQWDLRWVLGKVSQAAVYSLGALARLNPEPKAVHGWFQFLVVVEGILGPLQIALFLLAARRRVMR